jgi:phytoene dehydrogenase-like protein
VTAAYDTVIIGAGMSGLAAGIRLAYYDRKVCILERHTTIGGLNSFYRLGGRNYDVGLHAVTNYRPKGAKTGPLVRLLRQLRFTWDELALVPQVGSAIAFPGVRMRFTNDFELLESEVERHFSSQREGFRRLVADLADYDDLDLAGSARSARQAVAGYLSDPLLVEMLFCPIMFYGNAREGDMEWGAFSILFRSIFLEGLARPMAGVRLILKNLVRKFKELGGELRLRAGVRRMAVSEGRVTRLELDDGSAVEGQRVLSSAGWLETMRLCEDVSRTDEAVPGRLSFVESISVLDCQPCELGCDETVVFYNDSEKFHWERPEGLADVRSGVICSPNNFVYDGPSGEGMLRVTALANFDRWQALPKGEYALEKLRWYDRLAASAARYVPDFRGHVVATDVFTPTTIRRFTGHVNGAVYGAPSKRYDGRTHLENLFICGTDQGLVGIIGSIISGIAMANRHLLRD